MFVVNYKSSFESPKQVKKKKKKTACLFEKKKNAVFLVIGHCAVSMWFMASLLFSSEKETHE